MSVNEKMTAIANAIRGKTGKTGPLTLDQMATEIAGIETGGGGYTIEDVAQTDGISGDLSIGFNINRQYAFAYLTGVKRLICKNGFSMTNTAKYVFAESSLEEVICEEGVTGTGYQTFYQFSGCRQLRKVSAPLMDTSSQMFQNCSALEIVDVLSVAGDNTFNGCASLKTIVLRSTNVKNLGNNNAYWAFCLNGTPFDPDNANAAGGYVLVPTALVTEYQSATNWSVIYAAGKCTFLPLEEYTVDGTISGEIDLDKLNAAIGAT